MSIKLSKAYDPKAIESDTYTRWERSGFFNPDNLPGKRTKSFSISMPPPNVTGELHLGHATALTIEDVLTRFKRMQGYKALWVPGTDHAGIATQIMVERLIADQGVDRHKLGRDVFLKKVWQWKKQYGSRITEQIRSIGASCDWSREHFTMDPKLTEAVQHAFITMHKDGLIYRGERIISWCPRCSSAISDLEVKHDSRNQKLYYIRYPLMGSTKYITVATTRPETMLGDTAVAVNPKDKRYTTYIGQKVILPIMEREIPVIADRGVEKDFGTGAVKVTPAHDALDFEIGLRHKLPHISVIDEKSKMTKDAGKYYGKSVVEARRLILEELEEEGNIEKIEDYHHNVATCDRCHSVIEPLISKQWFIKTKPLAKKAIAAVKSKEIEIIPKRFEKVYFHWMNNITDWCISRQLWWGHQIPVWYCGKPQLSGNRMGFHTSVVPQLFDGKTKTYRLRDHSFKAGDAVKFINSQSGEIVGTGTITNVEQKNVREIDLSDPTHHSTYTKHSELITAFKRHNPDKAVTNNTTVFIYSYVFTPLKNSANGCETIIVSIKKPKACPKCKQKKYLIQDPDTLDTWFSSSLWTFSTLGWPKKTKDLKTYHPTSVMETGWDILFFWVARMTMMSLYFMKEVPFKKVYLHGLVLDRDGKKMSKSKGTGIDPILMTEKYGTDAIRLSLILGTSAGQDFRLYEEKIAGYRNFINKLWNVARFTLSQSSSQSVKASSIADRWILSRLQSITESVTKDIEAFRFSDAGTTLYEFIWHEVADWYVEISKNAPNPGILRHVLKQVLTLLHPFAPFVTEELWAHLSGKKDAKNLLLVSSWPTVDKKLVNKKAEDEFTILKDLVTAIRNARSLAKVPPQNVVDVTSWGKHKSFVSSFKNTIEQLAKCKLSWSDRPQKKTTGTVQGVAFHIELPKELDKRRQQEMENLNKYIDQLNKKLQNKQFVSNAPKEVVNAQQEKLKEAKSRLQQLSQ
ncbi:valine--tRNA ligase [Patescibacteria group bacterium]